MMIQHELTIVIPAYRCARYLPATVATALRVPGVRVVIVQNCSPDETPKIARQLQAEAPDRIEVIDNERTISMTENWQKAVSLVQTPFALKLDADDLLFDGYAEAALQVLRQNPGVGMVGARFVTIGGEDFPPPAAFGRDARFEIMGGVEAAHFAVEWRQFPASATMVFRMDSWRQVGGFDLNFGWCPDREMWFRMPTRFGVGFTRTPACYYRLYNQNTTAEFAGSGRFLRELDGLFRKARVMWPVPSLQNLYRKRQEHIAYMYGAAIKNLLLQKQYVAAFKMIPLVFGAFRQLAR
ncbi:MAG TPA: glycosyltransferase family 2 protein [Tepidisphaeraceae bacterium]